MPTPLKPGFIALHGNRSEDLAQAVIAWLASHPLDPLEQEVVLVQSNGIAEWFKMELARQLGVCGSTRVELPGASCGGPTASCSGRARCRATRRWTSCR